MLDDPEVAVPRDPTLSNLQHESSLHNHPPCALDYLEDGVSFFLCEIPSYLGMLSSPI